MNDDLLCPDCGALHREPLDGRLGYAVPCADCTLRSDMDLAVLEPLPIGVAA